VESPSSPGQLPVDVDLGENTAVVVGPISVDLDPDAGQAPIVIDTRDELDPVIDPVEEIVNTVVDPVTDAVSPVLDALTPITSGVNEIIEGIGL
ncbi:MAG TPA: hypothetical protein VGE43_08455, partial [Acidimicrobiales bacterium]